MQRKWRLILFACFLVLVAVVAWRFVRPEQPALITFTGHTEDVWSVAFSPDGQLLASGDRLGVIKIIDARTGKELTTLRLDEGGGSVVTVAFSPDGKVLAALNPVQMKRWQVEGWKELPPFEHSSGGLAGAFSPDNAWFAIAGGDKTVIVWDAATAKQRWVLDKPPTQEARTLAFRPDSQQLAFGGTIEKNDQPTPFIAALDMTTGKETVLYEGVIHRFSVSHLAYLTPDLLALAEGNLVGLLDLNTGQFRELGAAVYPTLAARPDGRMIAIGDSESTAMTLTFYDAPAWKKGISLRAHAEEIKALAFSHDNRFLASAGFDKTVKIWNLARLPRVQP